MQENALLRNLMQAMFLIVLPSVIAPAIQVGEVIGSMGEQEFTIGQKVRIIRCETWQGGICTIIARSKRHPMMYKLKEHGWRAADEIKPVGEMMDYEQVKVIIESRLKQWEQALDEAADHADNTVILSFEASASAARVILQDLETAYSILKAQNNG